MKKYLYKQKFGVEGDSKEESKRLNVSLYVAEEGMSKQQTMNLYYTLASGFVRFLAEEMGVYDDFEELMPFGDEGGSFYETKH